MTPEEARENLLTWIKSLLQNGYNILEIKKLQLSDFELMIEALEQEPPEKKAEETETTLDKAFPFLFG
ncbi:hypothetical protein [Streptococcus gallolyticus]|uniref:hypothetical protein n=1 Tax=Streptococcus gallolyticus TaxID=315405 RepID=UPI0022843885|nr:hypothetical protein [Streptococcus gallolyticus]MCY7193373.1 hypothetical protein [Streptococcus gallolyticus subsp. gallolyticus]